MSNETKYDVFEELLDAYDDVKSSDGNLHPTQELLDYDDRYDNAFPDDLPLIPKAVGDVIVKFKHKKFSLSMSYAAVVSVSSWMTLEHEEDFARAWVLGIWRVEETGEIVKLEAD